MRVSGEQVNAGPNLIEAIIDQILERESGKIVQNLALEHPSVATLPLYLPEEQRARLLGKLSGEKFEFQLPTLPSQIAQDYEAAIEQLLPQHPFLDGTGRTTSSAVFEADLLCCQLVDHSSSIASSQWASHSKPGNPFLVDMYKQRIVAHHDSAVVPPEHLGVLFASVQALAEIGEEAEFHFEEGGAGDAAIASMDLYHPSDEKKEHKNWEFASSLAGKITFLGAIGNVGVVGPVDVSIGDSQSGARVTAPTDIDCAVLEIKGGELAITAASTLRRSELAADPVAVSLVAGRLEADSVTRVNLFGRVGLVVEWPNARRHPWASYANESKPAMSPEIADARLALRRLVVSFRSHSKGRLARYHKKIEHRRMTKGELGTLVREALLTEGVLSLEGSFYFLDPDALGKVVQTNYADIFQKRFSDGVDHWLARKVLA